MPVAVNCRCGRSFPLKDEYAGKLVQCPQCGQSMRAPDLPETAARPQADPAFAHDQFLLRQKYLAVSDKYAVWDEHGKPILYVERPAHVGRSVLAVLGGLAAGAIVFAAGAGLSGLAHQTLTHVTVIVVGAAAAFVAIYVVATALSARRHVDFYRDENRQNRLLAVVDDRKFQFFVRGFTVVDAAGEVLARLRRSTLFDLFRQRWQCFAPDGSLVCLAKEDSVFLSLFRRLIGPFFGLLRTNFILIDGRSDQVIGEFNRKLTILDRHVLDLRADPGRTLDRRIALALGVMLDKGKHA
jgi:uncharacterized protein YxjI